MEHTRSTLEPWFREVNQKPTAFHIEIHLALELWHAFPSAKQAADPRIVDDDGLEPFVIQQEVYTDSILLDWAQNSTGRITKRFKFEKF